MANQRFLISLHLPISYWVCYIGKCLRLIEIFKADSVGNIYVKLVRVPSYIHAFKAKIVGRCRTLSSTIQNA